MLACITHADGGMLRRFARITSAMPPKMATDASNNLGVIGSPNSNTPPMAAITGTLSCRVAALVAFNAGNTRYQMAYPMPEASAPEATAYQKPALSNTA